MEWSSQFRVPVDDLDAEILASMVAVTEATLATLPLNHGISLAGRFHRVESPGQWLAEQLERGTPALICTGVDDDLDYAELRVAPPPLSHVVFELPGRLEAGRLFAFVREFGLAARAYWGHATPARASSAIARGAGRGRERPRLSSFVQLPGRLGWLSFWSRESLTLLGFWPGDPRASLFARVEYPGGSGSQGAVLQLTEDALDLDRPEHAAALAAAYAAFPSIAENWKGP